MKITKDISNKKITIVREFAAPVELVWNAWTESKSLDQWWAPKPWKANTKTMDFKEGGYWLYYMAGPDGTKMWARVDYLIINKYKSYTVKDSFCDENGIKNNDFPGMSWRVEFQTSPTGTKVIIEVSFESEADVKKIIEMGFEEGFTSALINLDELLMNKIK